MQNKINYKIFERKRALSSFYAKEFIVWHPHKVGSKVKVMRTFFQQIFSPKNYATQSEATYYGEYLELHFQNQNQLNMTQNLFAENSAIGTKLQITATQVFIQYGYKATTLALIAEKLNINKASIHYYFRNKKTLYESVLNEIFEQLLKHKTIDSKIAWFILTEIHTNEEHFLSALNKSKHSTEIKTIIKSALTSQISIFTSEEITKFEL